MKQSGSEEFELVVQQIRELIGTFRDAVLRCDISENEFWIWYSLIVLENKMTQQEICAAWSLHKQTVNTIVSGMVKKGYVVLEAIPGTRNHKRIRLTETGQAYGERVVRPVFEAEKRAFSRMPDEDREALVRILKSYGALLRQEMQEIKEI